MIDTPYFIMTATDEDNRKFKDALRVYGTRAFSYAPHIVHNKAQLKLLEPIVVADNRLSTDEHRTIARDGWTALIPFLPNEVSEFSNSSPLFHRFPQLLTQCSFVGS
jgi:hypothetical protein